ncbi:MAG: CPBP family intramembrane metalloprotease [Bacilli bacterium]|nr:CPBP family intramembrane metalloprotease [Bacilli bacterium]
MKKANIFIAFLMTIGFTVLTSLILAIDYYITRIWSIAYIVGYLVMIVVLAKFFKDELKSNIKTFKSDLKNNWRKVLTITILLTLLLYISNYLIVRYMGSLSENEIMAQSKLIASPILMGISIVILGPIVEEMIYRLPFGRIEKYKLLTFFIYSLIFAMAHIALTNGMKEFIYLIPYMFLSLSIGYSFYKTGNIYMSIIVHILNNLINVMVLLFL